MQQYSFIRRAPQKILGDDLMEIGKLRVAAMDVADRINAPPRRHDSRRPGQCDHCGKSGSTTRLGRAASMKTVFIAIRFRRAIPSGSPVFGLTSNFGKL